jgi:hypothetical protein
MSLVFEFKMPKRSIGESVHDLFKNLVVIANQKAKVVAQFVVNETRDGWPVAAINSKNSKGTISQPLQVEIGTWRFTVAAPYASIIEYGGYRGVGPKTSQRSPELLPGGLAINGGIYPTQVPSAPLRRAMSKGAIKMHEEVSNMFADI